MSQWTDRVAKHQIFKTLLSLTGLLKELDHVGELTVEKTQAIERLKSVSSHVSQLLKGLEPDLIPTQTLDNINAGLINIQSECNTFKSNQGIAHLMNANGHADQVLIQAANLTHTAGIAELEGIRSAATSYRRSVAQYQRYVTSERAGLKEPIESIKADLKSLATSISNEKSRIDSFVADLQKQFSESELARKQEWDVSQNERKDRLDALLRESESRYESALVNLDEQAKEGISTLGKRSNDLIEIIKTHRSRAEELVYVISNTGMVGGYQRIANRAWRSYLVWQGLAALSLIGLISFAIYAFIGTQGPEFSWHRLAGRAFVAAAFGILAAYAARQADRSESSEALNRRLELALASVDPYLVSLSEEERQAIKKELALKFFTSEPAPAKATEVQGTTLDVLRMMHQIIEDLSKRS